MSEIPQHLIELAEAASRARRLYEGQAMRNIAGKTAEERVEIDIAYRKAETAWMAAERAYETARDIFINGGPARTHGFTVKPVKWDGGWL